MGKVTGVGITTDVIAGTVGAGAFWRGLEDGEVPETDEGTDWRDIVDSLSAWRAGPCRLRTREGRMEYVQDG